MTSSKCHRPSRWLILVPLVAVLASCGDDSSSGETLRILVTNDDGVSAEGIDALVEALVARPGNDVTVSAPNGNRSGSGSNMGPSAQCGNLSVASATTRSGHPATAIDGCPADAVEYALDELYPQGPPHVVLSGINEGQNLSAVIAGQVSGTVGAAKTAVRRGVPALASSQGLPQPGHEFDYPAGVDAVLAWLEDNRDALARRTAPVVVENVNIPSCAEGSIRGTIDGIPLAPTAEGAITTQDCLSTLEDPVDDVQAFNNGFIPLSVVPLD